MNLTSRIRGVLYYRRNQIIYRFLLFVLGIFLVIVNDNSFPIWTYLLTGALYCVSLVFFRNKKEIVCIVLDFVWIFIILLGKPLSNICSVFLMCFPLVNCATFTLKSYKDWQVYFLFAVCYLSLTFSSLDVICLSDIIFLVPPVFGAGVFLLYSRVGRRTFREAYDAQDAIIQFYGSLDKPHTLYDKILSIVNKDAVLFYDIVCFQTSDFASFRLVNASVFVADYKLKLTDDTAISSLKNGLPLGTVRYSTLQMNHWKKHDAIAFPVISRDRSFYYLFMVDRKDGVTVLNKNIPILEQFFQGVSGILFSSRLASIRDHEQSKALMENYNYVRKAVNTMHFIRNRLTPIRLLIEIAEDAPEQIKGEKFEPAIQSYAKKADNELKQLLCQADYLLDPNNSPYSFEPQRTSLFQLIIHIKSLWGTYFDDDSLETVFHGKIELNSTCIQISNQGVELLLTEIMGNISKHSSGIRRLAS